MSELSDRLKRLAAHYKMTVRDFERRCNLANGYVRTISSNLGASKLESILQAFPEVSRLWLLTGEGEMLKNSDNTVKNAASEPAPESERYFTYLLPVAAMAGSLSGLDTDGVLPFNCERVVSPIPDVDYAVPVIGDSMEPEYPSGAQVMVRRIDPHDFIPWGQVFVLDTTNGPLLKEVQPSERGSDYILCRSHNPSGRYKPFDVPLSSVRAMFRVVACVSLK